MFLCDNNSLNDNYNDNDRDNITNHKNNKNKKDIEREFGPQIAHDYYF